MNKVLVVVFVFIVSHSYVVVGKVLGKKGAVISSIQQDTSTKMSLTLSPAPAEQKDVFWVAGFIKGPRGKVEEAFLMVRDIAGGSFCVLIRRFFALIHCTFLDEMDDIVLEIHVPKDWHIRVTGGPSLKVLKRISATYSTRVYVPDGVKDTSDLLTLEGNYVNVFRYKQISLYLYGL